MENTKSNSIELIILAAGWLMFSTFAGLISGLDELESSTNLSASAALLNALASGFLLFIGGLPVFGLIYFLKRRGIREAPLR